jgi:biopolymer transport protein TolR
MAFGSSGGSRRPLADINVTPLVDVMLVLLIIFMVTAPLIPTGVKVDLPKVKSPTMEKNEDRLVLAIRKDGRLFLADTEIPREQLAEKLSTNAKLQQDKELYLRADEKLPYGAVVDVMAIARDSGVQSIGMITDPPETAQK